MRIFSLLPFNPASYAALAVVPLKTIAFALFYGGACLASLANPICGVVVYITVYLLTPDSRWWGMPLADLGIRFSMVAALFTIFGMIISPHRIPKARPWLSGWELGLVLMVAIALTNNYVFGQPTTPAGVAALDKFWKMLLFVLILNRLASSRTNLLVVFWVLVIGSLYLGYDAFTAPSSTFARGRLEGIGGADFNTSSSFAAHMTAMLPLAGVAFLIARNWRWRLLAAASAAFTVNAIIQCRTRSAFIGLIAGIVAAFLMAPKPRRLRIRALVIAGVLLSIPLADKYYWDRMATMTDNVVQKDLAARQRMQVWRASAKLFADHPYGIGMANFPYFIGRYDHRHGHRSSHNTLIVCFVELGVQGGMVFLVMTVLTAAALRRSAKLAHLSDNPIETKLLTYGALVAWVSYFVSGLGTERLYCESYWWIFAMPHWIDRMVRREVEQRMPELALEGAAAMEPWSIRLEQDDDEDPGYAGHSPRPALS